MLLFSDFFVSGLALGTGFLMWYWTRQAFTKHFLNTFSYLMLILAYMGLGVRVLFFFTGLSYFNYDAVTGQIDQKPAMFSFFWTYPLINMIVFSYTASSHWVYDLLSLIHQGNVPMFVQRQLKVFVVASVIFVIIMYLVYMLNLPIRGDSLLLREEFFYLAIFEWLVAAILLCSVFLYYKRIRATNGLYGKVILIEALVFIISNALAGFFNYALSNGKIDLLLKDRGDKSHYVFSSIMIPYFCLTEFIPILVFAWTMKTLTKILSGEADAEDRQAAREQERDFR